MLKESASPGVLIAWKIDFVGLYFVYTSIISNHKKSCASVHKAHEKILRSSR